MEKISEVIFKMARWQAGRKVITTTLPLQDGAAHVMEIVDNLGQEETGTGILFTERRGVKHPCTMPVLFVTSACSVEQAKNQVAAWRGVHHG